MNESYGATPEEWLTWDVIVGCSPDLLPVVCRPNAPIAPSSNLTSYGKVPSRYDRQRRVVGFPAWTQHRSSNHDLERWQAEPDYGICLQTRTLRALDVDVTDPVLASRIQAFLYRQGFFPLRYRRDSSKFLILFKLVGDYAKQTLKVGGPAESGVHIIEFLATGQQCLVAGTHKDGCRYEWAGLDDGIPELTEVEWCQLKADLRREFGTDDWSEPRLRASRGLHAAVALDTIDDPVVAYAKNKSLILRTSPDGRLHVRCPWEREHTAGTDPTASTYFPAGTGGYETGHYLCLHAHCATRTTSDFLLAIGYTLDGFEDLTATEESAVLDAFGATDTTPKGNENPIALPRLDRDKSDHAKWTLPNVIMAMEILDTYYHEVRVAFDAYTDRLMVTYGDAPMRPFRDEDYTDIALRFYRGFGGGLGFVKTLYPIQILRAGVHRVAVNNTFDSAIQWLESLPPWDGVSRVAGFCSAYLGSERSPYSEAVSRYWWTAHAGRVLTPGVQADMAVVLISGQGTGKTSSVKAMVPSVEHYVEIDLSERDDNLRRSMRGKLIGELGELRGLATRGSEGIKAFVSRQHELWTPKYMEMPHTFARRLILVGTSNQDEFLADETGNRRWLPIEVGTFQDRDAIARDRDQLWAEAALLYRKEGVLWEEAQRLATDEHSRFEISDPWESAVDHWLHQSDLGEQKPLDRDLTIEEVLREALHFDLQRVHQPEKTRVGKILRKLGLAKKNKKSGSRVLKVWVMEGAVASGSPKVAPESSSKTPRK